MQRSIKASPAQKGRGGRGAPPEFGDDDPTAGAVGAVATVTAGAAETPAEGDSDDPCVELTHVASQRRVLRSRASDASVRVRRFAAGGGGGDEAAPPLEDDEIKPEAAAAAAPAAKAPSERQLKDLDARIAENTRNGRISWKSVLATLHKSDLPGDQSYWMRWSRDKLQEWCRKVRKRKRRVRKDKRKRVRKDKRKRPERKRSEASKQADREAQQRRRAERRISES